MLKIGFVRSKNDNCVYVLQADGFITYLVLYVDDLLLISENKKQNDKVKAALLREFEMTYDGKFEQFLGMGIYCNSKTCTI